MLHKVPYTNRCLLDNWPNGTLRYGKKLWAAIWHLSNRKIKEKNVIRSCCKEIRKRRRRYWTEKTWRKIKGWKTLRIISTIRRISKSKRRSRKRKRWNKKGLKTLSTIRRISKRKRRSRSQRRRRISKIGHWFYSMYRELQIINWKNRRFKINKNFFRNLKSKFEGY